MTPYIAWQENCNKSIIYNTEGALFKGVKFLHLIKQKNKDKEKRRNKNNTYDVYVVRLNIYAI